MGEGRGTLALITAATTADRVGEVVMAAATIAAVALMAITLPSLLRRRRLGRGGITPALVILTGAAAITFVSYLAFIFRCHEVGCRANPGDAIAGLNPWWRDDDSWQWGGQLALAGVALVLASIALALAVSERRSAGRAVVLARIVVAAWALIAFFVPAAWEIFRIR